MMSTTGYPDRPPARCGTGVADMAASVQGALAVVAALRHRDRTGEGQHITAPIFESTVSLMGGAIAFSDAFAEPMEPWEGGGQSQWAPYGVFETNDEKWVFIGPSSEQHWQALCSAMDATDLATDDRFETRPDRRENRAALDVAMQDLFGAFDRDEILRRLGAADVPSAPVNNTREVGDDPHLAATDGLVEISAPQSGYGDHRVPRSPVRSTGFAPIDPVDPPAHGEHTEEVLRSMGYAPERIAELREHGTI
jgi:crotonobetainyl-CoA:carnitine CoA-transferase CaiB-like acyl-CoA transferase